MSKFAFAPRVDEGDIFSTCLGVDNTHKFVDNDIGKVVKLGPAHNYVPVTAGTDEIEAVVVAIDPATMNSGFSFGSVKKRGRQTAFNDGATLVVGDLVLAGAQAALGTQNATGATLGLPIVRKGVPTKFIWRVIDLLTGGGLVNTIVVIEQI